MGGLKIFGNSASPPHIVNDRSLRDILVRRASMRRRDLEKVTPAASMRRRDLEKKWPFLGMFGQKSKLCVRISCEIRATRSKYSIKARIFARLGKKWPPLGKNGHFWIKNGHFRNLVRTSCEVRRRSITDLECPGGDFSMAIYYRA